MRERLHLVAQVDILTKELVDKEALLDERVRAKGAPSRLFRRFLAPLLNQDVRKGRRHGKLRAARHERRDKRRVCVCVLASRGAHHMSALRPDEPRRLPSPHVRRGVASQPPRLHPLPATFCPHSRRGSLSVLLSGCLSDCRSVGGMLGRQKAVPGHQCAHASQGGDLESGEGHAQEGGGEERCEGLGVQVSEAQGRVAELQLAVAHRDRQIEVLEEEVRELSKQGGALAQAKTARCPPSLFRLPAAIASTRRPAELRGDGIGVTEGGLVGVWPWANLGLGSCFAPVSHITCRCCMAGSDARDDERQAALQELRSELAHLAVSLAGRSPSRLLASSPPPVPTTPTWLQPLLPFAKFPVG